MSSVLIYHPLGLGDHIALNGLVREYAKRHEQVGLFCNHQNAPSVAFMYRDLPSVRLHLIRSHAEAEGLILRNRFTFGRTRYARVVRIGAFDVESGIKYERQFYQSGGLPLETLWESFYVKRDPERERALEARLPVPGPYLFVHDDARFPIDRTRIPSGIPVREPNIQLTDTIFDYCGRIEHAMEVHVVDSSFMFLVDCLQYDNPNQKLFVHRYARPNMAWNLPILKKPWTILV